MELDLCARFKLHSILRYLAQSVWVITKYVIVVSQTLKSFYVNVWGHAAIPLKTIGDGQFSFAATNFGTVFGK